MEEATLRVLVRSAEDGRPLQGASVVVRPPGAAVPTDAGITDREGFHEMRGLPPGRYALAISYLGFRTHRDTLQLAAGRRVYNVDLAVQPQALGEITIEAESGAAQRQAGQQTIRTTDIGRIPTPGPSGDLASYLQTLPGVVSVGDRGGQLYIRGGAPSQNRYLMDGLPVVQPFHISSFYSAFPQDIVQSADLYAGGFDARYAEATGSVLDVRLRPGNMKQFEGSAAAGPHLASVTAEGPLVRGSQSFLVSARYSLVEEVAAPLFDVDAPIGFYDVTGRYTLQRDNASCHITALRTRDRGSIGPNRDREFTWSNTVLGGRCFFLDERFGNAFSLRGGYTGYENGVGTAGAPEQTSSRWRVYLFLDQEQVLLGQPVEFGVHFTAGQYSADINQRFVDAQSLSRWQDMIRVYGTMDWAVSDRLTLSPSITGQVPATNLRILVDPRLRVAYRPDGTDQQELSLAAGLYHQIDEGLTDERDAGNVFTVWRPPAEDDPLPQSLHAIVGYRQRIGTSVEASVEGYAQRHANLLVSKWTPDAAATTASARADGVTYGMDARIEVRNGPLYGFVGYGWSSVTYEAATGDLGAWVDGEVFSFSPAHDRRHQLQAVASYEWQDVTANVSWELGSGRPYTQVYGFDLALELPGERPTEEPGTAQTLYERPYGERLPAYHRLDVSLERTFDLSDRLALDATVGAINAYDRSNLFYYDVNTLQRVEQSPLLPYVSLRLRTP